MLRRAFALTMADPELKADGARIKLDIDPVSGEELQAIVARLYATPKNIVERATQALSYQPTK